ncbi:unnamed protein product [Caenorhabditis angaria]|uniref:Uncharacterized protein n=1 Tax=Caenorhabditis angaria TaxID=860376 RepID=A0A9P1I482_9PELO|nr:unnamed protein product [Caenorhabditis angaria]
MTLISVCFDSRRKKNILRRYSELAIDFENGKTKIRDLEKKNKQLTEGLPDEVVKMIPDVMAAAQKFADGTVTPSDKVGFLWSLAGMLMPNLMNLKDQKEIEDTTGLTAEKEALEKLEKSEYKIKALQEELSNVVEESNRLRSMIREDRTGEKEQELEHLKKELMAATTLARNLFGEAMSDKPGQDPTTTLQMRILQLEQAIQEMKEELSAKQDTIEKLQFTIENKDEKNLEILTELNRFKDQIFGSSRDEITRLETQIKFRNEQISELQQHCTLLQVELGQYADNTYKRVEEVRKGPRPKKSEGPTTGPRIVKVIEEPEVESEAEVEIEIKSEEKKMEVPKELRQAMLISNLYYEMMELLEELSIKDNQLAELHNNWKLTQKSNLELKSQLEMAYEEVKNAKKERIKVEESIEKEMNYTEGIELQRLVESINIDGTEMERRLGEVTRKLITEKMERIRLTRNANNLKSRISRLEWAGRKLRESMRDGETQTARQIVHLRGELDLAICEIGKLQNRILKSVGVEEYDEVMRKYKRLLKQQVGVESSDTSIPRPDISILTKSVQESEAEAREDMLKKMLDIVTGQSEFWNREADILQAENNELKQFLEDLENENDSKSVLSSIERRLLDTIRDLRDKETQTAREKKRQRTLENERVRDFEKLKMERVTLLNVINVLQRENKIIRNQSMGSVSLQQLEILRNKIIETHENEMVCNNMKNEIENLKESTNNEYLMAKSLRNVLESENNQELSENTIRQLQHAFFNGAQQAAKCRILEKSIHLKERKMTELNEELEELKKWNMELLVAVENFRLQDFSKEIDNLKQQKDNQSEILLPPIIEQEKESDYESEESSSSRENSSRVIVRTIVQDNLEQFEYRIKELRDSAQIALQGYKDQIEMKNQAIERYKRLLAEKIDEEAQIEIVEKIEIRKVEVDNPKLLEKLEKAEKVLEKMRNERKEHVEIEKEFDEIGCQTELETSENLTEKHHEEIEEEAEEPPENNEKETFRLENFQLRAEIRDLKGRLRQLSKNNKELLITCEKIKEDAMEELTNFRRNNENSDERRISAMRIEIERHKSTIIQLRQSNDTLKTEITRLRPISESHARKSAESATEWEKRKKQEEIIGNLRNRLKSLETSEKQFLDRIEKREKIIETLKRDQNTRNQEIEKLSKKLKETDVTTIKNQLNSTWQKRITELEAKYQKREDEIQRKIVVPKKVVKSTVCSGTQTTTVPTLKEHIRKVDHSKISVKNAKVQVNLEISKNQEDVRNILRVTENRFVESQEKLLEMEKDYLNLNEKFERLKLRSGREEKPTGAVLVLSDKLQAKDREIAQLKNQIAHLQRTVQLPI